ncbi:hypothetical protein [Actinocorallia aurea]
MPTERCLGLPPALTGLFEAIELRASKDTVKTDLEVTCRRCDAEDRDTLLVLVHTALAHTCPPPESEPAQ